jgi:hypothetical protein
VPQLSTHNLTNMGLNTTTWLCPNGTMVGPLTHKPKLEGSNPGTSIGKMKKNEKHRLFPSSTVPQLSTHNLTNMGLNTTTWLCPYGTMVEPLTHIPKLEGSNPASGIWKEKMEKK